MILFVISKVEKVTVRHNSLYLNVSCILTNTNEVLSLCVFYRILLKRANTGHDI